jgi:hypothetical protein
MDDWLFSTRITYIILIVWVLFFKNYIFLRTKELLETITQEEYKDATKACPLSDSSGPFVPSSILQI